MQIINIIGIYAGTVCFICTVLHIISVLEQQKYISRIYQVIMLLGLVALAECVLIHTPSYLGPNMCSTAFLLVTGIIDERTECVYDCFGITAVAICSILSLSGRRVQLNKFEWILIGFYIGAVLLAAVLHGMGAGDVPIYLALLLYYFRFTSFPAQAAIFMLYLSQALFGMMALIKRKRYLPLVPYICLAHLITVCLWVP